MPGVPFVTDNYRDIEPPVNWYPAADQDKGTILFGSEGLDVLVTPQVGEVRAFRDMGDYLYVLVGSGFYQIDSDWNATLVGNKATNQGPAWIETNGLQVGCVGANNLHVYTPATGAWVNATAGGSPGASCFTYQDGYGAFVNPNTNQFYITASYDFTTIDVLDFASAEGWPDNIIAIIMDYRELWLVGTETTEFWENTGGTFPFTRIGGHGMVHQGISARGTLRRHDNGIKWLNQYREVVSFQGYQPRVISTPKMTREIETYPGVDDAVAFDYAIRGHNFYGINFPSGNATWIYDATTQVWHKRKSWQAGTPEQGRWRGNVCYFWNNTQLVGDYANGKIYKMDPEYLDDDGETIIRTLYSQEIRDGGKRIFFPGLQILFNHGVATGTLDPQAMLTYSDDGGRNWVSEHWVSAGKIGEYYKRSRWWRLGMTEDHRIFKLQVSDSQKWDILSVDMIQ